MTVNQNSVMRNILILITKTFVSLLMIITFFSCGNRESSTIVPSGDTIPLKNKNLALIPPMGWNSYDCFGLAVTETEVRTNARENANQPIN